MGSLKNAANESYGWQHRVYQITDEETALIT